MSIQQLGQATNTGLQSPHLSFMAAVAGVAAISQSPQDFNLLFGPQHGPQAYVVAKWFAAFCLAVAAYGKSVVGGDAKA
jgi:hypothetical protein